MHTVKPLDEAALHRLVLSTGACVTLEEHSRIGGLGGAVAEVLADLKDAPRLLRLGVDDRFPKVGSYQFVLDQCGLTDEAVASRVTSWLRS